MMPGMGWIKDCICLMTVLTICGGLYKAGVFDRFLDPRCWNYRLLPCGIGRAIKRLLLQNGHDGFADFGLMVLVHGCKDVKNTAAMGKASLHVTVNFWYESFQTQPSKEGRWEQSGKIAVPQGADECVIQLWSKGMVKTDLVGEAKLFILTDIKENEKARQKTFYKLMNDHKVQGQVAISFRDLQLDAAGRAVEDPLLEGMDDASNPALVELVRKELPNPDAKRIGGQQRLDILGRVNRGTMDRVGKSGLGGPKTLYFAAVWMPSPDGGQKPKWLWCWYKDEQDFKANQNNPEGFFALIKVTSVNKSLKKPSEWSISFQDAEKKKQTLTMNSKDRDAESWAEGFEFLMHLAKENKLAEKDGAAVNNAEAQEVKANWAEKGTEEKWAEWEKNFRKQGLTDKQIQAKKEEFFKQSGEASPAAAPAGGAKKGGGGKGGAKGGAKGGGKAAGEGKAGKPSGGEKGGKGKGAKPGGKGKG